MTAPYLPLLDYEATEDLRQLMRDALGALPPDVGCGHVTVAGSICVRCPADGVRCAPCAERHFDTDHDPTWRYTCDRCGDVDPELRMLVTTTTVTHRRKTVLVMPDGLGICRACVHLIAHGGRGGVG